MKAWELDEIRRGVKGKWLMRGESARQFNGQVCTDSRKAAKGDLFFAIKGERFDGHDFLRAVIEAEVAAIVVSGQWGEERMRNAECEMRNAGEGILDRKSELLMLARDKGVAVVEVDDTVAGLNRLAAAYRANELGGGFRAKVIAVGGSNGKTTTKRIIHALLAEKFGTNGGHASPKSFNNNIGMPLTLLEVMPSHEYVVLEIGTNAPGEIAALGEVCRPDIAVIVSVGLEHLEKLGDLAGVAREEGAIAEFVSSGGTLVLPECAELLAALRNVKAQRIVVGKMTNDEGRMTNQGEKVSNAKSQTVVDLLLTGVEAMADGVAFSVNNRGRFVVPLMGAHNADNALMAIAVGRRLGLSDEQMAAGLAKVTAAEGRMEVLRIGDWLVVNDAYNANPSSMEASLRTVSGQWSVVSGQKRRKIVILGDMLELGAASEAMHRAVGGWVRELGFDLFLAVGPLMALAANEVKGVEVRRYKNVAELRTQIAGLLQSGNQVLLKGSHGMALESLIPALREAANAAAVNPGPRAGAKRRRGRK